jgi:[lysine-biosynthesis-protein LysW]---L-2-aminoadipate ligase
MEDTHRGLLVNEVNNTVEFKGAQNVAEVDIADSIIQYAVNTAKK